MATAAPGGGGPALGALPGGRLLNAGPPAWFDVERFRSVPRRLVVVRTVDRPTVVLGSTQPADVVDGDRVARAGVAVVRRRSGGGAVYLAPGDPVWLDAWLPRGDPLWQDDVLAAADWAGAWWHGAVAAVLGRSADPAGADGLAVHHGPSPGGPGPTTVCFAGIGPGEVIATAGRATAGRDRGRKVVGLAQWRCRQGALVHGCAYRRWDPVPLVELLALPGEAAEAGESARVALTAELAQVAVGLEDLVQPDLAQPDLAERLRVALLDRLPEGPPWEIATA